MNENILRNIEKKLSDKYYVTNDAWLRDCVEYYLSEHQNPRDSEVLAFVLSQWQLSDLREISNEKPCLPRNLEREKCTILRGNFILQMEKVYDIAESKFKQLEKIRNVENDNINVTEGEKTQNYTWEPKKRRMLRLQLTDGVQDVIGIEYKPIQFLDDSLLPGYKLLIKGPVMCRRGIIMLEETCIEEIGGEIANLLVPNAVENLLARALNLPENPDPYKDNVNDKMDEDELFAEDFEIDIDDVAVIESDERKGTTFDPPIERRVNDCSANLHQVRGNEHCPSPRPARPPPLPSVASFISKTESDLYFDEIDDIFDDDEIIDSTRSLENKEHFPNAGTKPAWPSMRENNENATSDRSATTVSIKNQSFASMRTSDRSNSSSSSSNVDKTNSTNRNDVMEMASSKNRNVPSNNIPNMENSGLPMKQLSDLKLANENDVTVPSSKRVQSNAQSIKTMPGIRRSATTPPIGKSPSKKIHCPKTSTSNRKITDYMTKSTELLNSTEPVGKAYDTIRDILNTNLIDESCVYKTIRAKVIKMDKLIMNGQDWHLNATIADENESLETTFSSQILESILGFDVAEFTRKRKLTKTDPTVDRYLRQSLRNAESRLMSLDDLMEIELAPNKKPRIVKIFDGN